MMNWVENVGASIPDHSKDVRNMLIKAMNTKAISELDAHACALAAALISSNGELGFAIEMFGPLQRARSEINIAKSAASLANMHNIYNNFIEQPCNQGNFQYEANIDNTIEESFQGPLQTKFAMYSLAASVISHPLQANKHFTKLVEQGIGVEAIQDIVKIAAVINTIGKIAPEVDQLIPSKF